MLSEKEASKAEHAFCIVALLAITGFAFIAYEAFQLASWIYHNVSVSLVSK